MCCNNMKHPTPTPKCLDPDGPARHNYGAKVGVNLSTEYQVLIYNIRRIAQEDGFPPNFSKITQNIK